MTRDRALCLFGLHRWFPRAAAQRRFCVRPGCHAIKAREALPRRVHLAVSALVAIVGEG